MASTQPARTQASPAATKQAKAERRGVLAALTAHSASARAALAAAKGMPGWRAVQTVLGDSLTAGDTALLLQARGQAVAVRRRIGDAWQPPVPLAGDDAGAAFAALKQLAAAAAGGEEEAEFEVSARKVSARACRIAARAGSAGEEVLVLVGAEVPPAERPTVGRLLGRFVPSVFKKRPAVHRGIALPRVTLEPVGADAATRQAAIAEAAGYAPACELVGAAVQDRAGAIVIEAGPQGSTVRLEVDGVARPAPLLDAPALQAIVGVLQAAAGLDPKSRGPQAGPLTALVEGKPWPCTVRARRGGSGARIELVIEHGRPKFKTLADLGMPAAVTDRVQEFLKLESGLILLVAPRRGGLSTLFDGVLGAADRLLRDFVVLEDAAAQRAEIQNVRPVRWDSRTGGTPAVALDAALREYANVLATCDLEDAAFAQRLVAEAGEGKLVIIGLRGVDAADGLARLVALGADPQTLSRVLLGAVGYQLVRKLCPKCRHEYFPAIDALMKLKIDLGADVTLYRPTAAGCAACTGTGYVGRTAVCEVAAGPTVRAAVAQAAAADVLRKAAVKDGMVALTRDAIAKAARGVTSIEEIQRAFSKS